MHKMLNVLVRGGGGDAFPVFRETVEFVCTYLEVFLIFLQLDLLLFLLLKFLLSQRI